MLFYIISLQTSFEKVVDNGLHYCYQAQVCPRSNKLELYQKFFIYYHMKYLCPLIYWGKLTTLDGKVTGSAECQEINIPLNQAQLKHDLVTNEVS